MAVVKSWCFGVAATHANTCSAGRGATISEITFVSSTHTGQRFPRMRSVARWRRNVGGSRGGSRSGNSRSNPPKGSTSFRMCETHSAPVSAAAGASASRRISRASSSMDFPCSAARMRSFVFNASSSCRIVNVAMLAMIASPAMLARLESPRDRLAGPATNVGKRHHHPRRFRRPL
jgi:hypothetical protein